MIAISWQNLFGAEGPDDDVSLGALYGDIEVPEDDYRAIRRSILDLPTLLEGIATQS
jgi:hypothetical protein